jgi:hypothetical protein
VTTVVGALPHADDTIVSVQLGEAVAVTQDRPVIATISDRRRNATVRAMHAERRLLTVLAVFCVLARYTQII